MLQVTDHKPAFESLHSFRLWEIACIANFSLLDSVRCGGIGGRVGTRAVTRRWIPSSSLTKAQFPTDI
jgi:hypothetical protein